ncbi:MAG: ATP-binding protein [Xenococcaceae cyanobacterium]
MKHSIPLLKLLFCLSMGITLSTMSNLPSHSIEAQAMENADLSILARNKARSPYSKKTTERAKDIEDITVTSGSDNISGGTILLAGLLGILGISWVITCLKSISEERKLKIQERTLELEKLAAVAGAANAAKSQFLANMSHELRTPLNAILGFVQILARNTNIDREQKKYLDIIEQSGEHLLNLINDILEFSKIEANKTTLNNDSFDLYDLLNNLQDMLGCQAQLKGIELNFDLHNEVPQYLYGDAQKLRQILINLLSNGIKFTERGYVNLEVILEETIQANFQESDNICLLRFTVKDTGVGIEPQEIDKLFTAFVQTKVGIKSEQGTGLGLAISQKFVKLMGGEITVKSKPKQETIFTFQIPFKLGDTARIRVNTIQRKIIALESGQPTYRILVVDDNPEARMVLTALLTPLGFEVREAQNGREAIDIWSSWLPHLIWMDVTMPIVDGYRAAKTIKNHSIGKETKIIALTASIVAEERSHILRSGCDDFLLKPFRASELLEKISEYLGVRYVYEEIDSSTNINTSFYSSRSTKITQQIALEHLESMPVEWLMQLYQAAEVVDNKYLSELIDEIPSTKSELAEILLDLMKTFRVDKIIYLTEETLSHK